MDYDAAVRDRARMPLLVAALALGAGLARALAFSTTELYTDEAYYWLWSLRPAAGYYDHPPLVAWLVRAGTALAPGELGVRLLAVVCGALVVPFAALIARELSDDPRAPLLAALLTVSAPMLHVLGALALPDAPLVAAYAAATWLLARARRGAWIAAGLAVGVALLSKYTAALLAPALLLLLPWDRELRADLRTRWPWLGAAVALLVFAPCLAWNATHGWSSIGFQIGHAFTRSATWASFGQFVAGQVAGAGPVALALGVGHLLRPRSVAARRIAACVLVPLAVTTWSAARGKVEANWPALVYPGLAAAAAAVLVRARPAVARAVVGGSVALSAALLVAFAAEQLHPRLLAGTPVVERFHGWRALAAETHALARRACREAGCDPGQPFLFPVSYQYAAEVAFYGGFRRLGAATERPSQLDVWGDLPGAGEPFLFLGMDGVPGGFAPALGAVGEGPTGRRAVRWCGDVLRTVTVTPFARAAGGALRR